MARLSAAQRKVLEVLEIARQNDWCLPFGPIMDDTGLDRATVCQACRDLARNGLAKFYRTLWDEDGWVAGAGYGITKAGRTAIASEREE